MLKTVRELLLLLDIVNCQGLHESGWRSYSQLRSLLNLHKPIESKWFDSWREKHSARPDLHRENSYDSFEYGSCYEWNLENKIDHLDVVLTIYEGDNVSGRPLSPRCSWRFIVTDDLVPFFAKKAYESVVYRAISDEENYRASLKEEAVQHRIRVYMNAWKKEKEEHASHLNGKGNG